VAPVSGTYSGPVPNSRLARPQISEKNRQEPLRASPMMCRRRGSQYSCGTYFGTCFGQLFRFVTADGGFSGDISDMGRWSPRRS
jgi:hypothetical protein